MMSTLGYSVRLAENGQRGIEDLLRESHVDLILMDQHMPIMDGVEASMQIRKLEEGKNRRVPIIAFTATVIQEGQKAQFRELMDDFILKPVTMSALETISFVELGRALGALRHPKATS